MAISPLYLLRQIAMPAYGGLIFYLILICKENLIDENSRRGIAKLGCIFKSSGNPLKTYSTTVTWVEARREISDFG